MHLNTKHRVVQEVVCHGEEPTICKLMCVGSRNVCIDDVKAEAKFRRRELRELFEETDLMLYLVILIRLILAY